MLADPRYQVPDVVVLELTRKLLLEVLLCLDKTGDLGKVFASEGLFELIGDRFHLVEARASFFDSRAEKVQRRLTLMVDAAVEKEQRLQELILESVVEGDRAVGNPVLPVLDNTQASQRANRGVVIPGCTVENVDLNVPGLFEELLARNRFTIVCMEGVQ